MASKQDLKDKHELARLDKERERRNKNYLEFLDAVSKGEKRNYEQYRAHQRYVDKRDKEQAVAAKEQAEREAKIAKIRKQHIDQGKKSRDLARDHGKFLKSNTGVLLERLGIVSKESDFGQLALDAAKDGNLEAQKGLNVAGQLRKEAYAAIEMGTFDPISFENDLENS